MIDPPGSKARTILLLGGARSGKSARALALATPPCAFLATAEALDGEMQTRIDLHKAERGPDWTLFEEPLAIASAISKHREGTLVVDCLTLWLSNLMHHERDIAQETRALTAALAATRGRVVLVSNEVGHGIAPINAMARAFRDHQGRVNQAVAAAVDHAELIVAGLPLVLKSPS